MLLFIVLDVKQKNQLYLRYIKNKQMNLLNYLILNLPVTSGILMFAITELQPTNTILSLLRCNNQTNTTFKIQ